MALEVHHSCTRRVFRADCLRRNGYDHEPEYPVNRIPYDELSTMPDLAKPTLEPETIRRVGSEQLAISLAPAEIDAIATVLNGLLDEMRTMTPNERGSVEPESGVVVQEWPS